MRIKIGYLFNAMSNGVTAFSMVFAFALTTSAHQPETKCLLKGKEEICRGDTVFPVNLGSTFGGESVLCHGTASKLIAGIVVLPIALFGPFGFLCLPEYLQTIGMRGSLAIVSAAGLTALAGINACGDYATVTALRADGTIEIAYGLQSYFVKSHRISLNDVAIRR